MINTIVLDIGNVMAHFRWEEYLKDCGYEEEVVRKVGLATVRSERWREWDRGVQNDLEFFTQCWQQDPSVEKEVKKLFEDLSELVREYDYSADFVRQLKANGYRVYLLSNYPRKVFEIDEKRFQFIKYVDGGIISYKVSHIKPEPEIYEDLINKYNINPTEAVFLDDLQANLEGAKPFGFHTIQVKNFDQALEDLRRLGVNI